MSCMYTSTKINSRKKEGTASTTMTNSVKNLSPLIHKLIRVITDSNATIDGDCIMAVAFQQQGISTFKDLQMFDLRNDFENVFSTYKANDADDGTNSGVEVTIVGGVKMYI